jgi:hypothetical protein
MRPNIKEREVAFSEKEEISNNWAGGFEYNLKALFQFVITKDPVEDTIKVIKVNQIIGK